MEHKDLIEAQLVFIRSCEPREPTDLVLINLRDLIRKHLKRAKEEEDWFKEIRETREAARKLKRNINGS